MVFVWTYSLRNLCRLAKIVLIETFLFLLVLQSQICTLAVSIAVVCVQRVLTAAVGVVAVDILVIMVLVHRSVLVRRPRVNVFRKQIGKLSMIMLIFSYHILHSILGSVYTSMQFVYIHQTLLYKYCTCVYCMECIFPKISGLCMCTYVMHILYMRILHGMYIYKTLRDCIPWDGHPSPEVQHEIQIEEFHKP